MMDNEKSRNRHLLQFTLKYLKEVKKKYKQYLKKEKKPKHKPFEYDWPSWCYSQDRSVVIPYTCELCITSEEDWDEFMKNVSKTICRLEKEIKEEEENDDGYHARYITTKNTQ